MDGIAAPPRSRGGGSRYWLAIILVAVAVHLVILFGVKTSFLAVFRKSLDDTVASSSRPSSFPDAIVAVTVDVEGDEPHPVEIEPPPRRRPPADQRVVENPGEDTDAEQDLLDVLGQSQSPLPARPSTRSAVIPPRPVEITWPETRKLGHCLGLQVAVRIRVGLRGEILEAQLPGEGVPGDCAAAALDAARRIVFLPGTVDGRPEAMWTEVRIDFRKQSRP